MLLIFFVLAVTLLIIAALAWLGSNYRLPFTRHFSLIIHNQALCY